MLPPVSEPSAPSDEPTATDAPDPPLLPPGTFVQIPGIVNRAKVRIPAGRPKGKLMQVELARHDRAGLLELRVHHRIGVGNSVAQESAAARGRESPPYRPGPSAPPGLPCNGPRSRPSRIRSSAAEACSRASSAVTVMNALSSGSVASSPRQHRFRQRQQR